MLSYISIWLQPHFCLKHKGFFFHILGKCGRAKILENKIQKSLEVPDDCVSRNCFPFSLVHTESPLSIQLPFRLSCPGSGSLTGFCLVSFYLVSCDSLPLIVCLSSFGEIVVCILMNFSDGSRKSCSFSSLLSFLHVRIE
jgi:hypothetical protein